MASRFLCVKFGKRCNVQCDICAKPRTSPAPEDDGSVTTKELIAAAHAAGRAEALEEAAKVCGERSFALSAIGSMNRQVEAAECAKRIRAIADAPTAKEGT